MRISRHPSPVQITKVHKQLKNVEYFHRLGSIITNDESCTREIKFRISMAKTALNKIKIHFTGFGGICVAGFSLQHGYHSNPTTPKLQHTSNQEQYDQCGNSTE